MPTLRQGTSRTGRLPAAMNPASAPIDNRSLTTLMNYVKEVADLINYYDDGNEINGTWAQIFAKNTTFLLADISNQDISSLQEKGNHCTLTYLLLKTDKKKKAEILLDFIEVIIEIYQVVKKWNTKAHHVTRLTEQFDFVDKIRQVKETHFDKYYDQIRVLQIFLIKDNDLAHFRPTQAITLTAKHYYKLKKILPLAVIFEKLKDLFQVFSYQLSQLHIDAKNLLKQDVYTKSNHEPLTAMMIGFLRVFSFQQEHLNDFTRRHLDYYYYKILQQTHQAAVPDLAYLSFELNADATPCFLPKGTLLLANINEEGLESHYETRHDTWVSEASIAALQTLYVSKNPEINFGSSFQLVSNIYYAPIANSKDGLGGDFDESNKSWAVVGKDQSDLSQRQRTMTAGEVGFAISAPILHLEGGERKIILNFKFSEQSLAHLLILIEDIAKNEDKSSSEIFHSLFRNSIDVFITTAKGWHQVENFSVPSPEQWKTERLNLEVILEKNAPPFTTAGEEFEGDKFATDWPVLKILLNSGSSIYAYSFIQGLEAEEIEIETKVTDFTKLTVSNIAGEFNNDTIFPLFGALPEKNSKFFISSPELLLKNIDNLEIDIEWKNLPEEKGGFQHHYQAYTNDADEPLSIDNDSFKVEISAPNQSFHDGKEKANQKVSLFQMKEEHLSNVTNIKNINLEKLHLTPQLVAFQQVNISNSDTANFIQFTLVEPRMTFGHTEYPRILSNAVMHNAFAKSEKTWWKRDVELLLLPKEPYDPIVKKISLNYTAKSAISLSEKKSELTPEDLAWSMYQINPFGYMTSFTAGQSVYKSLLQPFGWDGYLIIGVDKIKPGLPLNLLFEFSDKGKKALDTPVEMSWRYLKDNRFIQFKKENFLYDTTFNFTTTGVVSLLIPEDINKNNTILSPDHYWFLVSARGKTAKVLAEALHVHTHAVSANWVDNGDETHYETPDNLPKIEELVNKRSEIASVTQIGSFFGGHAKETEELLRARLSERLRHKNRAVSIWDFERIVLEAFPQIRQVKCIGPDEKGEFVKKGHLKLVVVSEFMGKNNLQPTVNFHILSDIHAHLKTVISPHATVEVINPNYEKLKIAAKIILVQEFQNLKGEYLDTLCQEIEEFICPWKTNGDIRIGMGFKKKDLFNFIKSRPYIDFVTGFSVVHIFEKEKKISGEASKISEKKYEYDLHDTAAAYRQKEEISPSCPWGILVPADLHLIDFIDDFNFSAPQKASIEQMVLETDFVIREEEKNENLSKNRVEEVEDDEEYFEILNLE